MAAPRAGLLFAAWLHCRRDRLVCDRTWTATLDHLRGHAYARCGDSDAWTGRTIHHVHARLPVTRGHCHLLAPEAVHGNTAQVDQKGVSSPALSRKHNVKLRRSSIFIADRQKLRTAP